MFIDKELYFSENQAVRPATGITVDCENPLTKGAIGGPIKGLWLVVMVTGADYTNCTSLTFNLETSVEGFATDTEILFSKTVALAGLTEGAVVLKTPVPDGISNYLQMSYTGLGTASGAGTISAFLTPDARIV